MAGGQINFRVGYTVDKTGLQAMKASLQEIQNMTANDLMGKGFAGNIQQADAALKLAQQDAQALSNILTQSFNKDLGTVNIQKFNNALKTSNLDLNKVYSSMSAIGTSGVSAFRNMATQVMTSNLQLKKTSNLLDSMATTMGNTIKWGIASSVLNSFTGKVREAYGYVKSLDGSLNDIRIVTGKGADEMKRFADKANKAAKQLGAATKEYTDASLIYYQQGLSDKDTAARAEVTTKVANVTGQSAQEVSEQLTAVWNGYKVSADEAEMYIDKLSAVAATTASDLEELSTGMSKVASAANSMGVNADQLNAQLATIISVTRQAPESVGTALKTIYARMGDLAVDGEDEFGTKLGEVSGKMAQMGIQVLDQQGNLRDMGIVIEETAAKWDTWTEAQKQAAAVAMAGKRQYNNLIALFDNWDMYTQALNTSQNSLGRLQEQQDIYMESTAYHLQSMKTSWEDVYDSMLDEGTINTFADIWGGVGTVLANAIDGLGGGGEALLMLGSILMQVFSKQLASGISGFVSNIDNAKYNAQQLADKMMLLDEVGRIKNLDDGTQKIKEMEAALLSLSGVMSESQINEGQMFIKQQNELYESKEAMDALKQSTLDYYEQITAGKQLKLGVGVDGNNQFTDSQGGVVTSDDFNQTVDNQLNPAIQKMDVTDTLNSLNQLTEAQREYANAFADGVDDVQRQESAFVEYNNSLEGTADKVTLLNAQMKQLAEANTLPEKSQKKLIAANSELKSKLDELGLSIETALEDPAGRQAIDDYVKKIQKMRGEVSNTAKHMKDSFKDISTRQANGEVDALEQNLRDFEQYLKGFKNTLKIQDVLNTISAFGQLASSINTIKNLGSIWTNDDISAGEKLLQTVTNLGFALPMLANSLGTVSKALGLTRMVQEAYNASVLKSIGDETLATLTKEQRIMLDTILQKVISKQALSQEELNLVNTLGIASDLGLTAANGTLTLSFGALAGAIWAAMAPLLPYIIAIGAIVTVISLVVKASQEQEKQFQSTQEQLESLTESYNQAKTAAEDLKATIQSYEEIVNNIDSLIKGTDEFTNAIEEANQKARELIETYGLFNDYFINAEGLIKFKDDVLPVIQERAEESVKKIEQNKNLAHVAVSTGGIKKTQDDFHTDYLSGLQQYNVWVTKDEAAQEHGYKNAQEAIDKDGYYFEGYDQEAPLSKELFSNFINKMVKDANGNTDELLKLKDEAAFIEYMENINLGDKFSTDSIKLYTQELAEVRTEIVEIAKSTNAASQEQAYYNKLLLEGTIASQNFFNSFTDDKNTKDLMEKASANLISQTQAYKDIMNGKTKVDGKTYNEWMKKANAATKNSQTVDGGISDDEDLARTYAKEVLGKTQEEVDAATYTVGNDIGSMTGANGEKWFTEKDDDAMRREISRQRVYNKFFGEDTTLDLNKYSTQLENIATSAATFGKDAGVDFTNSMMSAIANKKDGEAVEFDFSSLFNELTPSEIEKYASMTPEQLTTAMGVGPEELTLMGMKTAEDYAEAFAKGMIGYNWSQKDAVKHSMSKLLSEEEKENYGEEVQNFAQHAMLIATSSDIIDDSLEENADAATTVALSLAELNDGVDTLVENMENWTDIFKNSTKESEEFAEAAIGMAEALGKIFGVDSSTFDYAFIEENLGAIERVAKGDMEAVEDLRKALIEEFKVEWDLDDSLSSQLDSIMNSLPDLQVGATVTADADPSGFIAAMNEFTTSAKLSAEQVQALWNSLGYEPVITMTEVEETQKEPITVTESEVVGTDYYTADTWYGTKQVAYPKIQSTTKVIGYDDVKTGLMVPSISSDGEPPKVESFTVKSKPSMANASSTNKGGNKSGGGSKKKPAKNEKDIYHDINIEIQNLANSMDKLSSKQEKLYGKDLLTNLQQQLDILELQEDAQRRKLAIAQQEQETLRKSLGGQGVTFNKDGTIANYLTLYDQKLAELNAALMGDDEDAADAAQEKFDQWLEDLERYDELTSSEIAEIEQSIQDAIDKQIELQIEAFEYEIQLKLDIKDAERDWNDFKKNMTIDEDDVLGNTEFAIKNLKTYLGDDGTIATLTEKGKTLLDQLNQMNATGTSSIYGDNRAALMEDLTENQEALMAAMEEQKDLLDEIEQSYIDMLDVAQEAFDEQIAQYEAINEVYAHGLNVINVLYGEDAYADMEGFYQKQMENNNQMIDMQRRNVEFYQKQLEDTTLTDEQREEVQRKLQEAQAALHASVESQIDLIINKYTNAINKIFQELENKMTNGKGLSYIQEEWDLLNQNAEMYLDQINSAYEIEKLAREYNKAIDATNSLSAQRKLNELMEQQLKGLREKDKLTQYDVDRANALLDVELKRIALEEAQQNKSKMRLRRDASGNYSYQFVSDEEATAEAQQELADAQNSLYNLDKDALQENQEAALNMWTEFKDKYIEIMSDVTLTDEEREARLQLIREQYGEMYNNLLMQNEDIRKNLEESALSEMKELNLDYILGENGLVPTWDSGVQQMMESFTGEGGLLPACSEAFGELSNLTAQYDADLALLEQNAGYSLGNIAGYTETVATQMKTVLADNEDLIAKYETELTLLGQLRGEVSGLMSDYTALITEANAAADAIIRARQEEAKGTESGDGNALVSDPGDGKGDGQPGDGKDPQPTDNSSKAEGVAAAIWLDSNYAGWGSGATRVSRLSAKGVAAAQSIINSQGPNGQLYSKWWKKDRSAYKYGAFDTGGYTGDWSGNGGKLAVLHKKELVLKPEDTKNVLQAVDIVRKIDGIMASIMGSAFDKANAQLNGLNNINIPVGGTTSSEEAIQQHIEINADFPGVERASEIISAFENLTNMATQYAFRTDR